MVMLQIIIKLLSQKSNEKYWVHHLIHHQPHSFADIITTNTMMSHTLKQFSTMQIQQQIKMFYP